MIENISPTRRISSYMVELSVPKACLTHTSAIHMGEVRKDQPSDRRYFRRSEHEPGAVQYLGVDQLKMDYPQLKGDYEGTMADKVVIDAVIEGEAFHAERTVADIFENPTQG
jgi:hypothetical protein